MYKSRMLERHDQLISLQQLNSWIYELRIAYESTGSEIILNVVKQMELKKAQGDTEFWDRERFFNDLDFQELINNPGKYSHSAITAISYDDFRDNA